MGKSNNQLKYKMLIVLGSVMVLVPVIQLLGGFGNDTDPSEPLGVATEQVEMQLDTDKPENVLTGEDTFAISNSEQSEDDSFFAPTITTTWSEDGKVLSEEVVETKVEYRGTQVDTENTEQQDGENIE